MTAQTYYVAPPLMPVPVLYHPSFKFGLKRAYQRLQPWEPASAELSCSFCFCSIMMILVRGVNMCGFSTIFSIDDHDERLHVEGGEPFPVKHPSDDTAASAAAPVA
jgi:hypothetical protein